MIRLLFAIAFLALLGACKTTGAVETRYKTVDVLVRAPCPDDATFNKVKDGRPVPLRNQAAPATADARALAERQQLGRYEAPGGWADQASAVIQSCHDRQPLDPP